MHDRSAGIWNHVRLRSTGAAALGEPRVDIGAAPPALAFFGNIRVTVPPFTPTDPQLHLCETQLWGTNGFGEARLHRLAMGTPRP
ncbi:hypothetical protein [Streptomyces sp. NBC_00316]|uniref:hypothetical protein n=1 Tax=Streptomyces sp. NBC_00316 TaxID=2975710 RepID=UPI002E29E32A|nr:hypothetical protein [Streptomyces sp. NBC_00316]